MSSALRVKRNLDLARRLKVIYRGDYRAFLRSGGDVIRDNIFSNIKHQITPTGSRLKKNKKTTLKIKRRLGKGQLSLIWDKLLINKSSWWQKSSKKNMRMGLTEIRKKIGRAVTKLGYKFMGISPKARKIVLARWVAFIRRGLK